MLAELSHGCCELSIGELGEAPDDAIHAMARRLRVRRWALPGPMREAEDIGWVPLLTMTAGIFFSVLLLLVFAPALGAMVFLILAVIVIVGSLAIVLLTLYRRGGT